MWTDEKCGQCKFFIKPKPDLMNLASIPLEGQCRESPPSISIIPAPSPQGIVLTQFNEYPKLPVDHLACSRFQKKVNNGS